MGHHILSFAGGPGTPQRCFHRYQETSSKGFRVFVVFIDGRNMIHKSPCLASSHCCALSHCDGGCYNCCSGDEIDLAVLPPRTSKEFDPHIALQDLRCIHGLSNTSLIQAKKINFEDIVRSTYEDQQRLLAYRSSNNRYGSSSAVWGTSCPSRSTFQRLPLIENDESGILTTANHTDVSSILPNYRCFQCTIAIIYFIIIFLNASCLLSMHIQGLRIPVFQISVPKETVMTQELASVASSKSQLSFGIDPPISFSDHLELASRLRKNHRKVPSNLDEDRPPQISWATFDYSFKRFDVFFTLLSFPVPFCFGILLLCLRGMMLRLMHVVSAGVCEYVRRTVSMAIRQEIDASFHDFVRRIDFFFQTTPSLKNSGTLDLHNNLHRALDALNNDDLRFDQTFAGPRYASRYAIRLILNQALLAHKVCFSCIFYFIPIAISFLFTFALITHVIYQTFYAEWRVVPLDSIMLFQRPDLALQNQGFRYIVMIICFNITSWIWILVLIADDFSHCAIYNWSFFEKVRNVVVEHANFLINCIWDVNVVQGILPFIESYKSPDLRWGDLHYQLSAVLQELGFAQHNNLSRSVRLASTIKQEASILPPEFLQQPTSQSPIDSAPAHHQRQQHQQLRFTSQIADHQHPLVSDQPQQLSNPMESFTKVGLSESSLGMRWDPLPHAASDPAVYGSVEEGANRTFQPVIRRSSEPTNFSHDNNTAALRPTRPEAVRDMVHS